MKKNNYNKKLGSDNGIILVSTLMVVLIVSIIAGGFISFAVNSTYSFKKWRDSDYAFLTAQTAIEMTKFEVYEKFNSYYVAAPLARSSYKFDWFGSTSSAVSTSLGVSGYMYNSMTDKSVLYGKASVVFEGIKQDTSPVRGPCDVKITATAIVGDSTFTITEIVRYALNRSQVFDYGYFVNNFGWFWGAGITVTGDVRANGNFSFKYGPDIYGDTYAAANPEIGARGNISGTYNSSSLANYLKKNYGAWLYTRPGSPTAIPASGADIEYWDMGYNGNPQQYEYHESVEMPYLGDLGEYKHLANKEGGTLVYPVTQLTSRGYTLSKFQTEEVSGVYDGSGPDGVSGTADDGCLVLVGTYDNPIVINGPVVVEGDLIIKGYFTGQGTIYVGRNTHIAGDLKAVNPPVWNKPDTDPHATAALNRKADMLALASKGNTVLGNYTSGTWYNNVKAYIYPNGDFCQPYKTDESDAVNGYDSDNNPRNGYKFNGDYRQYDGGSYLYNEYYGSTRARRYYESSINRSRFSNYADSSLLSQIDAVLYNNHLIVGYVGSLTFNGGIISRNEAINFNGSPMINWDIRLGSTSEDAVDMNIHLPLTLAAPITKYWYQR